VRREEGRLKTVTPLAIFLWELTGARSRSGFSGLPVWRRRKGVYRHGMVDEDTAGGIEERGQ
jgi:hypothetical protein